MYGFVNSALGWFHLATALLAMIAGAFVLAANKGTVQHKRVGYVYVVAMVLVCGSALGIYNLTGRFGVFHIMAIVSSLTLVLGMAPLFIKILPRKYKAVHVWFMYYSVLGLYAAFASELSVRIPDKPFFAMVGIATATIFGVGTVFILKKEKIWTKYFEQRLQYQQSA
ncbi:DUF2306 domain-containing protein [Pontibacter burrus]|uniref:DUF2306 domain-containing protein n=1 Tax=Pontibacter burrus TaxID=2704466 RepID=A0A6B3LXY9_9BACT|nr:DUF2306 domain-containing protein [Pontibacter burrus]NEM98347.1 DUF2306 domain-containing protein [Pontibacter burrus]